MKIELCWRHLGTITSQRTVSIPGTFTDYATELPGEGYRHYTIDEERLLSALPAGFLPVPPHRILITVTDDGTGTGQTGLTRFQDYAKYFDTWVLALVKSDPAPPDGPPAPDGMQLGTAACRALLEELAGKPVVLQLPNWDCPFAPLQEAVTPGALTGRGDWAVVIEPVFDLVSVRAQLGHSIIGIHGLAVLRPGADKFREYLYVSYPEDKTQISGPAFAAELKAAVEAALNALGKAARERQAGP